MPPTFAHFNRKVRLFSGSPCCHVPMPRVEESLVLRRLAIGSGMSSLGSLGMTKRKRARMVVRALVHYHSKMTDLTKLRG